MGEDSRQMGPESMECRDDVESDVDDVASEGEDVTPGREDVTPGREDGITDEEMQDLDSNVMQKGSWSEEEYEDQVSADEGKQSDEAKVAPSEGSSDEDGTEPDAHSPPYKKARHTRFYDSDDENTSQNGEEAPNVEEVDKPEDPEHNMDTAVLMAGKAGPKLIFPQLQSYIIHHAKNGTLHSVKLTKGNKAQTNVTMGIPSDTLAGTIVLKTYVESSGTPLVQDFYKSFPDLLQTVLNNATGAFIREFSSKTRRLKPADFLHIVSRALLEYTATRKKTADEANEILNFFDDFATASVIVAQGRKSRAVKEAAHAIHDEVPAHDWGQTWNSYLFAPENLETQYLDILSNLDKDRLTAEYSAMRIHRQNILMKIALIGMEPQDFQEDSFKTIPEFHGASPAFLQTVHERWEMASSLRAQRAPAPSPDNSAKNLGNLVDKNDTDAIIQLMMEQPHLLAAFKKANTAPTRAGKAALAYAAGPAVAAAGPAVAAAELEDQAPPAVPAAEAEGPADSDAAAVSRKSVGTSDNGFQLISVPAVGKVKNAFVDVALPDDTFVIIDSKIPVEILQKLKLWVRDALSANGISKGEFETDFFLALIDKLIDDMVVNDKRAAKMQKLTGTANAALRDYVLRSMAGGYVAALHDKKKMLTAQYIEAMTKLHASTFAGIELFPKENAQTAFGRSFVGTLSQWNLLSEDDASDVHAEVVARFEARPNPA